MSAPQPGRTWELDGVVVDDPFNNFGGRRYDSEWWEAPETKEHVQTVGRAAVLESAEVV